MPENPPEPTARPPRKRRWIRYTLLGFLVLLITLLALHRLIVVWVVGKVIARENLAAEYQLSGNLITNIRLQNLVVQPIGEADVQRIEIRDVRLTYDLRQLYGRRLTDIIKSAYVRDALVEVKPIPPEERIKKKKPKTFAINWNDLFEQPILFADRLDGENFTFISHEKDGDVIFEGVTVHETPETDGWISAKRFQIPNFADWRDLKGTFKNEGESVTISGVRLDDHYTVEHATISAATRKLIARGQVYGGEAQATLTQKTSERGSADGDFSVTGLKIPDMPDGVVDGAGTFAIAPKDVTLSLSGSGRSLETGKLHAAAFSFRGKLSKRLLPKPVDGLDGLRIELLFEGNDLVYDMYAADHLETKFSLDQTRLTLHNFELSRGPNKFTASGSSELSRNISEWVRAPFDVSFDLSAPQLTAFLAEPDLRAPNGSVMAKGNLVHENRVYRGEATLSGTDLVWQEFRAGTLDGKVRLEENALVLDSAIWRVGEKEKIMANGKVNLQDFRIYEASIQASIADLKTFQPFIEALGRTEKISGGGVLNWQGSGPDHKGTVAFTGTNIQFGTTLVNSAHLNGSYTRVSANFPNVRILAGDSFLRADVLWNQPDLTLSNFAFLQKNVSVALGSLSFPLDLSNGFKFPEAVPQDGKISADLRAGNLDIQSLMADFGAASPVAGRITIRATASGSVREPLAEIEAHATGVHAPNATWLKPTDGDALFFVTKDSVKLDATIRQPELQPMKLNGMAELNLDLAIREKRIPDETPIEARLQVPRSGVGFVKGLVPQIRFVEGDLTADITAKGTFKAPVLNGSLQLSVPGLRFNDPLYPAVNGLIADLRWTGDRAEIARLSGNVSGGTFAAQGQILFPKLTEPVFDLSMSTNDVLVARNEHLTVRATSDLKLTGPFAQAAVTGKVAITRSRFFRDIEIIPIELPGKPAPKPPPKEPGFSLTAAPFRDWTFDVAIVTADPFLVRGNLANGSVIIDTRLAGTGLKPALTGQARMENFTATLPFSKLQVKNGALYFSEDHPFVPYLDLQGTSTLRNYVIDVYVYGTPDDPKSVFTSEPPLPQEEIISLLATGTTIEDLTSTSDAVAGRAAVLAVESLSKKLFKRRPTEFLPFAERLNLDIGGVDPRTGNQEISARFQLSEHFYIIGELDVQGNVRAQLRYLIRFK